MTKKADNATLKLKRRKLRSLDTVEGEALANVVGGGSSWGDYDPKSLVYTGGRQNHNQGLR